MGNLSIWTHPPSHHLGVPPLFSAFLSFSNSIKVSMQWPMIIFAWNYSTYSNFAGWGWVILSETAARWQSNAFFHRHTPTWCMWLWSMSSQSHSLVMWHMEQQCQLATCTVYIYTVLINTASKESPGKHYVPLNGCTDSTQAQGKQIHIYTIILVF